MFHNGQLSFVESKRKSSQIKDLEELLSVMSKPGLHPWKHKQSSKVESVLHHLQG